MCLGELNLAEIMQIPREDDNTDGGDWEPYRMG
jgi:hypothetical protein